MPDWTKIKAEYIRGGTSYRKLAKKYSVSFGTLQAIALKEKWTDLRRQSNDKATTKIVNSVAGQEAKRVDMFDSIADELLQRIKEGIADKSIFATHKYREITGAIKDLKEIKGDGDVTDRVLKVVFSPELEEFSK